VTRQLYNAALQERKDAYRMRSVSISAKQQYAELTAAAQADLSARHAARGGLSRVRRCRAAPAGLGDAGHILMRAAAAASSSNSFFK
jgi:hypothetical protein